MPASPFGSRLPLPNSSLPSAPQRRQSNRVATTTGFLRRLTRRAIGRRNAKRVRVEVVAGLASGERQHKRPLDAERASPVAVDARAGARRRKVDCAARAAVDVAPLFHRRVTELARKEVPLHLVAVVLLDKQRAQRFRRSLLGNKQDIKRHPGQPTNIDRSNQLGLIAVLANPSFGVDSDAKRAGATATDEQRVVDANALLALVRRHAAQVQRQRVKEQPAVVAKDAARRRRRRANVDLRSMISVLIDIKIKRTRAPQQTSVVVEFTNVRPIRDMLPDGTDCLFPQKCMWYQQKPT